MIMPGLSDDTRAQLEQALTELKNRSKIEFAVARKHHRRQTDHRLFESRLSGVEHRQRR